MTKVKICGITGLEDALTAAGFGVDMLGFNFFKKSPRYIEPDLARVIVGKLPSRVLKVGVFVNMEPRRIGETVRSIGLDSIQLHGDEDAGFVDDLHAETDARIIKAFRIGSNRALPPIAEFDVDFILLDTFSAVQYGGTGKLFDWSSISELRDLPGVFLAGGLNAENVAGAIRTLRPYAVDVASGVESSPGKKDASKVEAFIRNANA